MPDPILLEVLTPARRVLSEHVSDIRFPTAQRGCYGILPGHTPLMTPLGDGLLTYLQNGQKHCLAVFGGFAEAGPDRVTVLAGEAETPEMIDLDQASANRAEALQRLKSPLEPSAMLQAQAMLNAAEIRIQAAGSRSMSK